MRFTAEVVWSSVHALFTACLQYTRQQFSEKMVSEDNSIFNPTEDHKHCKVLISFSVRPHFLMPFGMRLEWFYTSSQHTLNTNSVLKRNTAKCLRSTCIVRRCRVHALHGEQLVLPNDNSRENCVLVSIVAVGMQ